MAIKAGQILHVANDTFVLDRVQSASANVNIPKDRIYELGNYYSLGYVRDIPDLGFTLESYDVTWELPALMTGTTLAAVPSSPNNYVDPAIVRPIDITAPFKTKRELDTTTGVSSSVYGVAMPYLFCESISMRFGVTALTSVSYGLRGDSLYWSPGVPLVTVQTCNVLTSTVYNFKNGATNTVALPYNENGTDVYALNVVLLHNDNTYQRLNRTIDYTETNAGIQLVNAPLATDKLRIVFGADPAGAAGVSSYNEQAPASSPIHSAVANTTPAALRGRFVELWVNGTKMGRVQDATVNWRVNLERDEEFNNFKVVDMTYNDTPEITGAFTVKGKDSAGLFATVAAACGTSAGHITGGLYNTLTGVEVELKLKDPVAGTTISAVNLPSVTFDLPGYDQRVASNNQTGLNYYSNDGAMRLYKGAGLHG